MKGCVDFGIVICIWNKGMVYWGGVVEWFLGKVNMVFCFFFGKIGWLIVDCGDYLFDERVSLIFVVFECCIVLVIIDYNQV